MSMRRRVWAIGTRAVLLGGFGVAAAQTADETAGPDPMDAPAAANLTTEQMKQEAATYLPQMEQGGGTVRRQLEEARAARDVVKVQCLNDKLTQLDVAIRSARDRYAAFMVAVDRGDTERARHEFTVLQVLRDRGQELVAEAAQCIGEETGFVGESRLTVEIEPGMPDPAAYPESPVVPIPPPPQIASPTQ
jgi:hypothetical protein